MHHCISQTSRDRQVCTYIMMPGQILPAVSISNLTEDQAPDIDSGNLKITFVTGYSCLRASHSEVPRLQINTPTGYVNISPLPNNGPFPIHRVTNIETGKGRTSVVFEAQDVVCHETCAVKTLLPGRLRVQREARILAHLRGGPNIVSLIRTLQDDQVSGYDPSKMPLQKLTAHSSSTC